MPLCSFPIHNMAMPATTIDSSLGTLSSSERRRKFMHLSVAMRTIRNLYVENERVVLEGLWKQGFMAIAAIGATNDGSIELFIEPEIRTNRPRKKLLPSEPPDERVYEPEGVGPMLKKKDEVAAFNMGSTVVLVFQAPADEITK